MFHMSKIVTLFSATKGRYNKATRRSGKQIKIMKTLLKKALSLLPKIEIHSVAICTAWS